MNSYIIYGLVDPITHELRYIGKSVNGLSRPNEHTRPHKLKKLKTHCNFWIKSLIRKHTKPEIIILEESKSKNELFELEKFWIEYFKSIGANLTNHTIGGEGSIGYRHKKSTKQKISRIVKNRFKNLEFKEKFSKSITRRKPIFNQNGEIFSSGVEAAEKLDVSPQLINLNLNNKCRHAKQYVFRYLNGPISPSDLAEMKKQLSTGGIYRQSFSNKEGKKFNTIREASEYYKVSTDTIRQWKIKGILA